MVSTSKTASATVAIKKSDIGYTVGFQAGRTYSMPTDRGPDILVPSDYRLFFMTVEFASSFEEAGGRLESVQSADIDRDMLVQVTNVLDIAKAIGFMNTLNNRSISLLAEPLIQILLFSEELKEVREELIRHGLERVMTGTKWTEVFNGQSFGVISNDCWQEILSQSRNAAIGSAELRDMTESQFCGNDFSRGWTSEAHRRETAVDIGKGLGDFLGKAIISDLVHIGLDGSRTQRSLVEDSYDLSQPVNLVFMGEAIEEEG